MSRIRVRVALVLLGVLSPIVALASDRWSEAEIRAILADRIDRAKQSAGIVAGVIDDRGRIVVGHGRCGPDDETRPGGDTIFEIGSVTKVFTATLLADMVRDGKVALRDPVQKFLPESVRVPTRGEEPITLYHLTTHTSGLPRMPDNFAPADPGNPYADYSVQQMYEFLSGHELARDPGTQAEYSNVGAGLLGHVLALRAGTDYETLVRKRITAPLGMADTTITLSPEQRERLAHGHDGSLKPVSNWDIPALAGAGALRSTVNDMLKFVAANLGLVDSELSAALQETRKAREDFGSDGTRIGLGWLITHRHDRTIHWHNGATGGYHAFVGLDEERRRGVVVLSNASPSIEDIGFHLLEPKFELADVEPAQTMTEIPDSPAGAALKTWLATMRTADAEAAEQHYEASFAEIFKQAVPLDDYMGFRSQLRGILQGATVEQVVTRGDHDLSAYVKSSGVWFGIHLQVTPGEPHLIVHLLVQPSSPPEEPE
jgi:D-alanyl-D-alanine-carboxypeptidase/D-alanyl-D-alanine-endopeptidase